MPAEVCSGVRGGGGLGSKTTGTSTHNQVTAGDEEGAVRPSQPARSAGFDSEMSEMLGKPLWRAACS